MLNGRTQGRWFCPVCYRKASMRKGKSVRRTKSPGRNGRFRMRWNGGGIYPARHYGRQRPLSTIKLTRAGGIFEAKERLGSGIPLPIAIPDARHPAALSLALLRLLCA